MNPRKFYLRLKIIKVTKKIPTLLSVFFFIGLLVGLNYSQSFAVAAKIHNFPSNRLISQSLSQSFPLPKTHPLLLQLAQWEDKTKSGDYFEQIQTTKVGYLIWSEFPVRIYIETPRNLNPNLAATWVQTITQTVQEWGQYLPLQIVPNAEIADIQIMRKVPPLQGNPPRARSALATYELYTQDNFLRHKFTILLSPSQTGKFLLAASRHELGHALGIWGHSLDQADALYFSQVANPPQISARDVNTLKRIYQQPTSLGWKV